MGNVQNILMTFDTVTYCHILSHARVITRIYVNVTVSDSIVTVSGDSKSCKYYNNIYIYIYIYIYCHIVTLSHNRSKTLCAYGITETLLNVLGIYHTPWGVYKVTV